MPPGINDVHPGRHSGQFVQHLPKGNDMHGAGFISEKEINKRKKNKTIYAEDGKRGGEVGLCSGD